MHLGGPFPGRWRVAWAITQSAHEPAGLSPAITSEWSGHSQGSDLQHDVSSCCGDPDSTLCFLLQARSAITSSEEQAARLSYCCL